MLTPAVREQLIEYAVQARQRAYAPYSGFLVGAALATRAGGLFSGCNVENASYGLTVCAERTAAFQAVATGQRDWLAVAVAAEGGAMPCGACRQVLREFADDLIVLIVDTNKLSQVAEYRLADLLPHSFQFHRTSP
ncbi:MAG: cytidine deaminase [Pirellulaceae bacterium]